MLVTLIIHIVILIYSLPDHGSLIPKMFMHPDEQEVATAESTKEKAATGYKTQRGRSWHGQISLVIMLFIELITR